MSLANWALNTGEAAGDSFIGIEGLGGSAYNDVLIGDGAANELRGWLGHDTLYGGDGSDVLVGMDGHDVLIGGIGGDHLNGGAGIDTASYESAASGVFACLSASVWNTGEAAGDSYSSIENLTGSAQADVLIGDAAANGLRGLSGSDVLRGELGADTLDGGEGFDWAEYYYATSGVTVNLANAGAGAGEAAGDVFVSVEGVIGSAHADHLTGNAAANHLEGKGGHDTLSGGLGADTLEGGAGADAFVFATALGAGNVDWVSDFNAAEDKIFLDRAVFTELTSQGFAGLTYTGPLWQANFKIGASATGAYDRIIYDSATGGLFYDMDGTGTAAQVKFAELSKGLALTAGHFMVV